MSEELPQGWATAPIDALCDKLRGVSYQREDASSVPKSGHLPILRANNIQSDALTFVDLVWVPVSRVSEAQRLRKGDVVIAMSSGSKSVVGKTAQALEDWDGGFGAFCGVLRPTSKIDSRFFGMFLRTHEYRTAISELAAGSNINNLKNEHFAAIEVPVAPLPEQHRIVAKLEVLLGKVDACRKRLEKIPVILKRFRQSVLAAACSGRLTADWREEREPDPVSEEYAAIQVQRLSRYEIENAAARAEKRRPSWGTPQQLALPDPEDLLDQEDIPGAWMYCRLGNLAEIVRGASPRPAGDPRYFGGSIPWITVAELTKDETVYIDQVSQYVTEEGRQRSRFIKPGTLLLSNSGATLGVPKITRIGGCINDGSVALVDIPQTLQLYLYYFLKSQTRRLRDINQGAAQPNLNTEIVKNIITPLPPLPEQHEIVRRVEALFALADQIETRYTKAKAHVDRLTQSILAKAFRGDLVPQDPKDEPASVLLERIREERAGVGGRTRRTRR